MSNVYLNSDDEDKNEEILLPYRILSVLVEDKPGVLFRITNLFMQLRTK